MEKKDFDFDMKYYGKKRGKKIFHTVVGFCKLQVWDVKYGRIFLGSFHEIHL